MVHSSFSNYVPATSSDEVYFIDSLFVSIWISLFSSVALRESFANLFVLALLALFALNFLEIGI